MANRRAATASSELDRNAEYLQQVCLRLLQEFPSEGWWPARSPFEIMVGAVLVQNTRWVNAAKAIQCLAEADCLTTRAVAACPPARLNALIRPAGCQSVKARRLVNLAAWIRCNGGCRALAREETRDLRRALLKVNGVGPETADAILCFAFRRPVFIADQYARRWLDRIGWVRSPSGSDGYEHCRRTVEAALGWPQGLLWRLHAAIVLHSQAACRREPDCARCALQKDCIYYINNQ